MIDEDVSQWRAVCDPDVHFYVRKCEEPPCTITIEVRPPYCDRGRYIAKLFPEPPFALQVDHQDGWPRYYFDLGRAMRECEAWLIFRARQRARRRPRTERT